MRRTTVQHLCVVALTATAVMIAGCGNGTNNSAGGRGGGIRNEAATPCPVFDPAEPQTSPTLIDGTPANTPEGARLSQAIGAQGRGAFADVYATQITDHPPGRVALCVTDLARGRLLVAAAHEADPEADPARADLYTSSYSHRTLGGAVQKITGLKTDFPVYTVSGGNGESVEVTTSREGAASPQFKAALEKATGGIPVTVREGEAITPLTADKPMTPAP